MLLGLHHQTTQLTPQVANCVKLVDTEQIFQHRNVLTKMMHVIYVMLEDILQPKVQVVQMNAINVLLGRKTQLKVLLLVVLVLNVQPKCTRTKLVNQVAKRVLLDANQKLMEVHHVLRV